MKHVRVFENNPGGSTLTSRCLDALTVVAERRVLRAVEPECYLGSEDKSQSTTLANPSRSRNNQVRCIGFFY